MLYDNQTDQTDPGGASGGGGGSTPWWEGPRPQGYSGPWPPPLPPGAHYGSAPGSIEYPALPPSPGPYDGTPQPTGPVNPNPADSYHPEWYGNTPQTSTPPPGGTPPPSGGAPSPYTTSTNPGISPTPTTTPDPNQPSFTAPSYTPPPAFAPPPKFSYADFVDPNPADLQNDPVYQYQLKTQQDAIQRSATARGVLNTGGTINDLLVNANDIASQGYHDLWNRKAQDYATNRSNAFDNYLTNYNIDRNTYQDNYQTQYKDPFTFNYQQSQDQYNAKQHNYDQNLYYQNHTTDQNKQYNWYQTLFNYQQQSDEWDRKFRLLGLV